MAKSADRDVPSNPRERIIREAKRLFLERGYDGASMSELARRAEVTTPALYWHFSSKSELCQTVLERVYRDFVAQLAERVVGTTPEQRLRSFSATYVELQLHERDDVPHVSYSQLLARVSDAAQADLKTIEGAIVERLKEILRDGEASGDFSVPDLTVTAFALLTICEYVYVWFSPSGRLTPGEVGSIYADLAMGLVAPQHPVS